MGVRRDLAMADRYAFEATRDLDAVDHLVQTSRDATRELLVDNWPAVEAAALALLERRRPSGVAVLSGEQVAGLVAVPGVPFRPGPPANLVRVTPIYFDAGLVTDEGRE